MGAPAGVDVGAVREKEVGDLEVTVDDCPRERGVENLLHTWARPTGGSSRVRVVGWEVIGRDRPARACRIRRTSASREQDLPCRQHAADHQASARCESAMG